jgi:hypothetical protein
MVNMHFWQADVIETNRDFLRQLAIYDALIATFGPQFLRNVDILKPFVFLLKTFKQVKEGNKND